MYSAHRVTTSIYIPWNYIKGGLGISQEKVTLDSKLADVLKSISKLEKLES